MKSGARLDLSREQILAYRRQAGGLSERLPMSPEALRQAAWVGLMDSSPRAALLQLHARIEGVTPTTWQDPALSQVWGPMFSVFVVAEADAALFTLGRLSTEASKREFAIDTANKLDAFLAGRRMSYGEAGHAMGRNPNSLRYGTTTGRLRIRWEGARSPLIWTVAPPEISPGDARLELARRYLHIFGPTTPQAFLRWAGVRSRSPAEAFDGLRSEITLVRTPIGEAWVLTGDEAALRAPVAETTAVRLLPSGDSYWLAWGADRELMVPDAKQRAELWTPRVWPGAVLVEGEIVGTWRRANAVVDIAPWVQLTPSQREAVEAEARSFPLPGLAGRIVTRWLR